MTPSSVHPSCHVHERRVSAEKVREGLRRYKAENWTILDLMSFYGLSRKATLAIFRGKTYKEIERPEGLVERNEYDREKAKAHEALELMKQNGWCAKELQEHLGWASLSATYALIRGELYSDKPKGEKQQ